MKLARTQYLLDLNVLIALAEEDHQHHLIAQRWFLGNSEDWGTCALTQSGFVRVMANPSARGYSVNEAKHLLLLLTGHPGHKFWSIADGWASTTSLFEDRIFGHQQVTDAYLLGLAVRQDGVLVTFDKGLSYLAGASFVRNVLVL